MKVGECARSTGEDRRQVHAEVEDRCADFDRLAGLYRWMEWLSSGPFLQWCRCAWIERMRENRRALVLGDGDGRFTARLLRANAQIRVDAVDASPAMLRALMRRAETEASRVKTQVADLRDWMPALAGYDLIVTHFLLDCLTEREVRRLVRAVRGVAADGAIWVVSEFAIPRGWLGRIVATPVVATLYRAFGWLSGLRVQRLPDYAAAFRENGFALEDTRTWLGGMLASEVWKLRNQ